VNEEISFKMVVQTLKAKKVAADCNLSWGDGDKIQAGTEVLLKHTYQQPGKYTISAAAFLKESRAFSLPQPVNADITVSVNPPKLTLTKSTPTGGAPGYDFTIKAQEGSYPVGNWTLSFGDGNSDSGQGKVSKTLNHVYSQTGSYKVEFSVTDSTGAITKKSLTVTKTTP
jgi:PKD repeat protein